MGRDGCGYRSDLGLERTGIFLQKGLETGMTSQPDEAGQELGIFES
jgi:hypothetical protein